MRRFGLIGKSLQHSFSASYFEHKFRDENITGCRYDLFPLPVIAGIHELVKTYPDLEGLNITIPYKKAVIPFLHWIDHEATAAGSVNTIRIIRQAGNTILAGYNTDITGFELSLSGLMPVNGALILGTGGASGAVSYVLDKLNIPFVLVSRYPRHKGMISYGDISTGLLNSFTLIINTTPVGMFPDSENCPEIPYHLLSKNHILYDLIYNPELTLFLRKGLEQGTRVKNGIQMLHIQADKAWELWQGK